MIQRATDAYLLRLTTKVEEGGFWHLHHRGIDPPGVRELAAAGFADEPVLTPLVQEGAWIVRCPHCPSSQFGSPNWLRFLCADCANVAFGRRWLHVEWPGEDLLKAGEAALLGRPDPMTRWWDPTAETIGALLAENVMVGGLLDAATGAVAGDIGFDQTAYMLPPGPAVLNRGGG